MSSRRATVAVIGLGSMGLGMARSLLREGHDVRGFDVSPTALAALVEAGGSACTSPADAAAAAGIVVVVVVNAAQTRSTGALMMISRSILSVTMVYSSVLAIDECRGVLRSSRR